MMITGVHIDPLTDSPVRWRVENSWVSFHFLLFAGRRTHSTAPTESDLPLWCTQGPDACNKGSVPTRLSFLSQ
jgi:hypothetical protein